MGWIAVLLVAAWAGLVSAQPAGCILDCSVYTESCERGRCECRPEFFGGRCDQNFHVVEPDLFYGLYSFHLALAFLGSAFGVFLILYYFFRFVPKAKVQNQQILAIFMVTVAAVLRFISSSMYVAYGASTVTRFFYRKPNAVQFILRYFNALYYPLALGTLTLQVLIWMEFVMAVKSLKPTAQSLVPRLKWVFFPALAFLFIFVTVIQALLTTNTSASAVLLVYRVVLGVYIAALLVLAIIFAARLLLILRNAQRFSADHGMSSRTRSSRRNLTRMVLVSCAFVIMGFIMSILYIALPVDFDPVYYWPFHFVLRAIEMALVLSLLVTALAMMRNRIAYSQGGSASSRDSDPVSQASVKGYEAVPTSSSSPNVSRDSNGPMLGRSFKRVSTLRGKPSNDELQEPLMDYSNFGSTVEEPEMDDDPNSVTHKASVRMASLAGGAQLLDSTDTTLKYEYQRGELVWAQYRMDGLWYAARVETSQGSEISIEYLDYELSDTLPITSVCPDHMALLTGKRLNQIKAFDSRPTRQLLEEVGAPQPDTFGLVRLRGKSARKPNHSSLLLKRGSDLGGYAKQ